MRAQRTMWLRMELAGRLLLLAAALLLRPASGDGPPGPEVLDEAAIMSRLRRFAHDSGLVTADMHWGGWDPGDRTHQCHWHHVQCDDSQRVTTIQMINDINFLGGPEANRLGNITFLPLPRPVTLPPELAQLQRLEALEIVVYGQAKEVPSEWGQPGAFPSLTRLVLDVSFGFTSLEPLPPVEVGAFQALQALELDATYQHPPLLLPPSWGRPGVFLALQTLTFQAPVALPLPSTWSQGFPRLSRLILASPDPKQVGAANFSAPAAAAAAPNSSAAAAAATGSAAAAAPGQGPPADAVARQLPDSWGAGFPSLTTLSLTGLGLSGPFPAAWEAQGSFPSLRDLSLRSNNLTGPLPARVPCNLPSLATLELAENQFTGTLPPEWARCQNGLTGVYLASNRLVGPAFPDAWVAPNTSLSLVSLSLQHNRGLGGTLPASLPWEDLKLLILRNTSVSGSMPEQWCTAQFARELRRLDFIDSQISLKLPPCAAQAMPNLKMVVDTWTPPVKEQGKRGSAAGAAVAGSTSTSTSKLLLLLLAGVVGTAAAVAAAAHRWQPWKRRGLDAALLSLPSLLLRRRRPRQRDRASDGDDIELLAVEPDAQAEQLRHRQPHGLELAPGRARMKALVQRQMGRSALPSGRWEKQLLSMSTPPHQLAHQLDSKLSSIRSGGSGSQSNAGAKARGGALTSGQRWGLESDSLRMDASDLQFIAEDDGGLVQLGEGAHAVVYLAKWQDLYVGVKVLELQPGMRSEAFWHEISLLRRCKHPRIVPVYGVAIQNELLMVAVQLMLGGSLRAILLDPERQRELRWGRRGRQVALDVAEALVYLHEEARILHSDVKSANTLLDQEWRAALSDFGVAQVLAGSARTAAGGSSLYAAPEQLLGRRCTLAADIYSMGLLLVELLTRRVIIRRGDWELPRPGIDCPQEVADLIDRCLSSEPLSRPSAAEVLQCLRDSGGGSSLGSGGSGGSERGLAARINDAA